MTLKADEAMGEQPLGGARLRFCHVVLGVRHCLSPGTGCSSFSLAMHSSLAASEF